MTDTGLAARRAALAALQAVDEDGAWSNLAVPEAISTLPSGRDRAFAAHLAYDTIRWDGTLRWALGQVLSRPFDDIEPAIRRVLLMGAVQVLKMQVPARAAVATSATLAGEQVPGSRAKGARGFVNGVLRALTRTTLPYPEVASSPVQALSLSTGHPQWVVVELLARFDATRAEEILHADNTPPGLTLRALSGRDELIDELVRAGVDASAGALDESVRAPGADPRQLDAVSAGRAVPQDEASMRVVRAAAVAEGARVLDLCAGPGGKSTHLATLAGSSGSVTAVELHRHRARLVREAAARQGLDIEVLVGDATDPPVTGKFDTVLLDAPCTGLGTGRRRPEVRWRRTEADVASLAKLQFELLCAAAARVEVGGSLTYAVCTWTGAETDEVVDRFEASDASAGLVATERFQLWPDVDDTDGMFVATWRLNPADAS